MEIEVIVLSIRAKVAPEHCSELMHFVTSILEDVRQLDGCLSCHCYQSVEDDCSFCFVEQWSDSNCLESHMHSDIYSAISGAFKVLGRGAKVELTYTDPNQGRVHRSSDGAN